jgi:hypothetical protein
MTDAGDIARGLGGKQLSPGVYLVRCPVPSHGKGRGDRTPSLIVQNGAHTVLFKCFAGCDVRDILDVLRRRGLVEDRRSERRNRQPAPVPPFTQDPDPRALEMWLAAAPAPGSLVESYLRHRGITLPPPPSLRCGTRLHLDRYPMPAMIAAVQRPDGRVVAVQSTLLTHTGRKAPASTSRITTGALGAGAVRLAKAADVLGLAEGVETGLAAMQMTNVPVWTCLGAARMHRVELPETVRELHLFGDNDEPGRCAVERTAHVQHGRRVVLRFPPDGCKDWNYFLALQAADRPAA